MAIPQHASLTPREREIAELLTNGIGPAAITERLVLSIATARAHIRSLHVKSATHGLVELLHWAYMHRDCCVCIRSCKS